MSSTTQKKSKKSKKGCQKSPSVGQTCTKKQILKGVRGKTVATVPNQTSTMDYAGNCGCSKKKKVSSHWRCPPNHKMEKGVKSGNVVYPKCTGGVKPYKVTSYSRCKPTRGGCGYANPR